MTNDEFTKWLYDTAAASDDVREFVSVGRQLYALALSKLPPDEREAALRGIEDFGTLREMVERFPGARRCPEVPYGTPH